MADELRSPEAATPPAQAAQQFNTDASGISTVYTNFCRVSVTPEELVLDFGLNTQIAPTPTETVKLSHRIVMNFFTAKRLLGALMNVVQAHEQSFGRPELDCQNMRMRGGRPTMPTLGRESNRQILQDEHAVIVRGSNPRELSACESWRKSYDEPGIINRNTYTLKERSVMRTVIAVFTLAAVALLFASGYNSAGEKKDTVLKGKITCNKCDLGKSSDCQTVIVVQEKVKDKNVRRRLLLR